MTPQPARRESRREPWGASPPPPIRRGPWLPSPTFVLVGLIFAGSGAALFHDIVHPVLPFVFIMSGWIVSLCLHEFSHAIVAYAGGDKSVASSGYLTLDPLKYAHPLLSIVLPSVFIALGGFAFPGGAILVNTAALRGRVWDSLVSLAGPAMTALLAVVFGAAFTLGMEAAAGARVFYAALAFLCFLQVTAVILNLLPIPGLDGFGILRPWLPRSARRVANMMGAGVAVVLLVLFIAVPEVGARIIGWGVAGAQWLGVPREAVVAGRRIFAFWSVGGGFTMNLVNTAGLAVISMAVLKLGMLLNEPGIDRRRAFIWGGVLAAVMVAAALGYEWVVGG